MKKFAFISTGILFSFMLFPASAAKAFNLVENGSFEAPLGPDSGGTSRFREFEAPSSSIPGWSLVFGSVDVFLNYASDGNQSIDLTGLHTPFGGQGPGTLQQTLMTVAGTQYNVSFDLSAGTTPPAVRSLQASILSEGSTIFSETFSFDQTNEGTGIFSTQGFDFLATSSSSTLVFTSLINNSFNGPIIDNVNVEAIPTPALLPGLLGMGIATLRKRRQEAEQTT